MRFTLSICIFSFLVSCTHSFDTSTVEGRLKEAQALGQGGQYTQAIAKYATLLESSETPKAIKMKAQWSLANLYFEKEDFAEAELEYLRLTQFYSASVYLPEAYFKKGLSILNQIPKKIERDLSRAPQSLQAFKEVIHKFPKTKWARKAKRKISLIQDKLVQKELYIGDHYLQRKKWLSAYNRFKNSLDLSRGLTEKGLYGASLSAYRLQNLSYKTFYEKLQLHFPKSSKLNDLEAVFRETP